MAASLACSAVRAQATAGIAVFAAAVPDAGAASPGADPGAPAASSFDPSPRHPALKRLLGDVKDYYTSPLRWDGEDWALFGGALGAIAIAHQYDSDVRAHFVGAASGLGGSTSDLQDALPAAALWFGTYLYGTEFDDKNGVTASWAMLEAAGLATVTNYAVKFAAGRRRPDETTGPDHWFASGSSFPSEHAAAAWAVGTVFAESGEGGFRWVTRFLGYGIAGFTSYERLKHNAHWLSDVVAGAALGASTGVFVLNRTYGDAGGPSAFSVVPVDGGLMLAYHRTLP